MNADQHSGRYTVESWERTRQEARSRGAEIPPQRTGSGHSPTTLGPGVVEMSLRGAHEDVEKLVTAMRDMGIVVWRADSRGTNSGNLSGYRYFSVEVPRDTGG